MGVQSGTTTSPEVGDSLLAGGLRTNVQLAGKGPPVLLLHGSGPGVTAFANWRLAIPALSEHFRVVAPDIVGFGYTERPERPAFDLGLWVGHAVGVLDALEIERASVIGNSFGGALALHLAHRHPERVERLVLMGSVGTTFELTPGLDEVWGYEPSVAAMAGLIELFAHDSSRFPPDLARLRYEASVRPGVQESYRAMFPAPRQRGVDSLALDDEALRAIANETMLIHGRDDRVIPLSSSLRMLGLIDAAQLHIFGRCGHWVQLEQAERFHRLVIQFLSETTPATSP